MTHLGWIREKAWCETVGETPRSCQYKRLGEPSKKRAPEWIEGYHWKTILGKPWIHYERVQEWVEKWETA